MKKLFVTLAAVLVSVSTFAQGTVNFNNRVTGQLDAPVTRQDGSPAGPTASAQLYLVTGTAGSYAYAPIGQVTTFRAFTSASPIVGAYVNPIASMSLDGHAPGSTIGVVMRAWEGASYETAALKGQSNDGVPIMITLGGEIPNAPTAVAANLIGLQAFTLVPEPSTIALGILGAAALLYRRRK